MNNANLKTLSQVAHELGKAEATIKRYILIFNVELAIDLEKFDYMFSEDLIRRLNNISRTLNDHSYAEVKKLLDNNDHKVTREVLLKKYGSIFGIIGWMVGFFNDEIKDFLFNTSAEKIQEILKAQSASIDSLKTNLLINSPSNSNQSYIQSNMGNEKEKIPISNSNKRLKSENNKIINIIWGAGATAFGGYRTSHAFDEILDRKSNIVRSKKIDKLISGIQNSFDRTGDSHSLENYLLRLNGHYINIMLGLEEVDINLIPGYANKEEVLLTISEAINYLLRTAVEHYKKPPSLEYYVALRWFVNRLFSFYDTINIFTPNYDLVPEYVFSSNPWFKEQMAKYLLHSPYNELSELLKLTLITDSYVDFNFHNGILNFNNINLYDTISPPFWSRESYDTTKNLKNLLIFRLRGCVAWFESTNQPNSRIQFIIRAFKDADELINRVNLNINQELVDSKFSFDPLKFAYENLNGACIDARTLLIIGYSFSDKWLIEAISFALQKSIEQKNHTIRRIIILDPFITSDIIYRKIEKLKPLISFPLIKFIKKHIDIKCIKLQFPPKNYKEIAEIFSYLR